MLVDRTGDEVVDRHDLVTSIEEGTTEVRSQETCSARDDHSCHGGGSYVADGERPTVARRVDSERGAVPLHEFRHPHPGVSPSRPAVTRSGAPRGDHRRPHRAAGAILRIRRHRGDARARVGGAVVVRRDRAGDRAVARRGVPAHVRRRSLPGNVGRVPAGVPRPGVPGSTTRLRRPHHGGGVHPGPRRPDGSRRSVDVRRLGARRHDPAAAPGGVQGRRPPHAARGGCGGRCVGDLQGPGHRGDLRAGSPVPRPDGAPDALAGARRQCVGLPRVRRAQQHPADLPVR